jgi:deazaflavin-dependent oxidoreductase (nitroreductase family)
MFSPAMRHRVLQPLQQHLMNPVVRLAWDLKLPIPGDALLETTGRRTGRPRHTPVCDGLAGDTFWLVSQRGRQADWVRNIEANPRVRIKVRGGPGASWRTGAAHVVDADDPRERQRIIGQGDLARWFCVCASRAMDTSPLTIRIDLDHDDAS